MKWSRPLSALVCLALWAVPASSSAATKHNLAPSNPNLGSNVIIFTPSMSESSIQSELDAISAQQVSNQFGTQRYSIFFEPGTYGSATTPLDFQVGFYTQVAGLGADPGDVVINGAINVFNQCVNGDCEGTDNFWRSVSNLTLNVALPSAPPAYSPEPGEADSCLNSNDLLALSQADPIRRVIVNGSVILQDYCGTGDVSGGYLADDEFNNGIVGNYGQQQYFTRNSNIDNWSNFVWNQVFMGDNGAPAQSFGTGVGQYTTLPTTPVSEEEPFLYAESSGTMRVFVPSLRRNSVGPSYAAGHTAGHSLPISDFFVASPTTPVTDINHALARGLNLILTPGVYDLPQAIKVDRPNTIVLGLGFATLIPQNGNAAVTTANVPGIKLSGMIIDAGPQNSQVLMRLGRLTAGRAAGNSNPNDPTLVQDVFFRIGGAEPGSANTALVVDDNQVILDDIWAWRADHGNGVGWTLNTAENGLVVNGNHVLAYGLAVEHFQKNEVIWNGQEGEDVFFQNEMPYDPPSQSAWMASPTQLGYPAFLVTNKVKSFQGYGMGSYSFFNGNGPIYSAEAFQAPDTPGVQFNDLLTVFLNPNGGQGGINSVINGVGGSSTVTNPDTAVDVTTYP